MEPEHEHGAAVVQAAQRSIMVFASRREQHMNSRAVALRQRTARYLCDRVARLLVEKIH